MYENINWMKLAHMLSIFSLNLRPPFVNLYLRQISYQPFKMYTQKIKTIPFSYVCYVHNALNNTTKYPHVNSYVI